jgi:hypothetical protein
MIPAVEILLNRFSAAGDNNMFPVTSIRRREYGKTENDTAGQRRGQMGLAVHRSYDDRSHYPQLLPCV